MSQSFLSVCERADANLSNGERISRLRLWSCDCEDALPRRCSQSSVSLQDLNHSSLSSCDCAHENLSNHARCHKYTCLSSLVLTANPVLPSKLSQSNVAIEDFMDLCCHFICPEVCRHSKDCALLISDTTSCTQRSSAIHRPHFCTSCAGMQES